MIERIKALFPLIIILVIVGALINIGAIPGKEPILHFLGLSNDTLPENARPLDYVPGRIHELQPSTSQIQEQPTPSSNFQFSPTPIVFPTPTASPSFNLNSPPPPPPAHILGSMVDKQNLPLTANSNVTTNSSVVKDASVWQTIKNYFSGIL